MSAPDFDTMSRALAWFEALAELPAPERQHKLLEIEARDTAAARELRSLLEVDERSELPLDRQALWFCQSLQRAEYEDAWLGRELGRYRLTQRIGEGSTATVFLAQVAGIEHPVAVKLLKLGAFPADVVGRFRQERDVLQALEHPSILRVFDAGEASLSPDHGGKGIQRPYLVTEWVDGVPITEYCERTGLDRRQRLELFLKVCAAIQHAHRHLIVHCDLKPAHVLVQSDGTPKVLDFGIAKLLSANRDSGWTDPAVRRPFTLAYASPEQVRGIPVTTSSDVYALGVMLYEILLGLSPYDPQSKGRTALEWAVVHQSPRVEEAIPGRSIPRELNVILAQAMRKDPNERYATVADLTDDIERYLHHRPLKARAEPWPRKFLKALRRRPLATASAVGVLALLAGGWFGTYHNLEATRHSEALAWRAHAHAVYVTKMLAEVLARLGETDHTAIADLDRLLGEAEARLTELQDMPEAEARLRMAIAEARNRMGQGRLAVQHWQRALVLTRETRGLSWRDQDTCLRELIRWHLEQPSKEALTLCQERLQLLEEHGAQAASSWDEARAQWRRALAHE